jgi:Apea-like HEPN
MKFTAIALLNPHWHSVAVDGQVRNVTPNVTYEQVPTWFRKLAEDNFARQDLGEHADDEHAYCLCTRYDSTGGAEAVTAVTDIPPNDRARKALQTASLMLWLSRRTSFAFDRVVIAEEEDHAAWVWKELTSHDVWVALPSYASLDIEAQDFTTSYDLAGKYTQSRAGQTVQTACHALGMSLTQSDWPLRYLTLWLVLESLFGPEDARETTFRLCQRMALFLAPRGEAARSLFKQLNESYRWRSKIVHGMRLQKLEAVKSLALLEALEGWVHSALRKVISSPELLQIFDTSKREEYLDELALGH